MQTMCHGQLIVVSPDAKLNERVDLNITDIDLALVVVDEVDFYFIVHCFCLVNFNNLLLLDKSARVH